MPVPVGTALVAAHDPHRTKADSLVYVYRAGVGARWIDRQAMMRAFIKQPSSG